MGIKFTEFLINQPPIIVNDLVIEVLRCGSTSSESLKNQCLIFEELARNAKTSCAIVSINSRKVASFFFNPNEQLNQKDLIRQIEQTLSSSRSQDSQSRTFLAKQKSRKTWTNQYANAWTPINKSKTTMTESHSMNTR